MYGIGQKGWKGPYISFRKEEVKCFSFDIPYNQNSNIRGISITLNETIFLNETRPHEWPWDPNTPGISFAMHLKSQLLLSYSTMKNRWNKRDVNSPTHYEMEFAVNTLDIVTYRNKKREPCVQDWKDYDKVLYEELMDRIGCQVKYWKLNSTVIYCNTTDEFEEIDNYFQDLLKNIITPPPPCRTIKQTQYEYKDIEYNNDIKESGIDIVVDFKTLNHHYKEISLVEAYTAESFMGKTIKHNTKHGI